MNNKKPTSEPMDVDGFYPSIKSRLRWILVLIAAFVTAGHFIIKQIPTVYLAKATVINVVESKLQSQLNSGIASFNQEQSRGVIERLQSRTLAQQVVEDFNLTQLDEYKLDVSNWFEASKPEVDLQHAIDTFLENLTIIQSAGSPVTEISYQSQEPKLAAKIANHLVDLYLGFFARAFDENEFRTSTLLSDKMAQLRQSVDDSNAALKTFEEQYSVVDLNTQTLLANHEIEDVSLQKIRLQERISDQHQLLQKLASENYSLEKALQMPEVTRETSVRVIVNKIKLKEATLAKLAKRYKYKHPKIIVPTEELKVLKENLNAAVQQLIRATSQKLALNQQRLTQKQSKLEQLENKLGELGHIKIEFERLKKEAALNQNLYDNILLKVREARVIQDISKHSEPKVLDVAQIPSEPDAPNLALLYTINLIASFLLSIIIVYAFHLLYSDNLRRFRKLADYWGVSIRATIPKVRSLRVKNIKAMELENFDKKGSFKESIRSLRTSYYMQQHSPKVIAFTSTKADEGKSAISIHTAKSFGELEKVLLIDADLRCPAIAKELGLKVESPGLTNLIARTNKLSECIHRNVFNGVDVMLSGVVWSSSLAFLSNKRLEIILNILAKYYDRIIIECPPVMSVSDAFLVAKYVDDIEIIADMEKTTLTELSDAVSNLIQARVPVRGIVLNKVKDSGKYYYNSSNTNSSKLGFGLTTANSKVGIEFS